jgi:molybdopterin converting factor small subunit
MTEPTHTTEISVRLPHSLRHLAGGRAAVRVSGATVGAAIEELINWYPALRSRLKDAGGGLRSWMLFFLNDEDIRAREGEQTPVADGDVLAIVPVAEGG